MLSIALLPAVSVYTVSETGSMFLQILDDFHLQKHQVEAHIWIYVSKRRLRSVLKLTNGNYMYLKMQKSYGGSLGAQIYLSHSLDLLERRMSNATFDAYRTRRKH